MGGWGWGDEGLWNFSALACCLVRIIYVYMQLEPAHEYNQRTLLLTGGLTRDVLLAMLA